MVYRGTILLNFWSWIFSILECSPLSTFMMGVRQSSGSISSTFLISTTIPMDCMILPRVFIISVDPNTSVANAFAWALWSWGICCILKVSKCFRISWDRLKYDAILSSRASKFPVVCPTTNCESECITRCFPPRSSVVRSLAMRASYSASLLVVGYSNLIPNSIRSSSGVNDYFYSSGILIGRSIYENLPRLQFAILFLWVWRCEFHDEIC